MLSSFKAMRIRKLERGVRNGDALAMIDMGHILDKSHAGVAKDVVHRVYAERGDRDAMLNLGHLLYHGGSGVPKDLLGAKHWYERAAEAGHFEAMFSLGALFEYADGSVTKDLRRAIQWYERAAEGGTHKAMGNLGVLYYYGGDGVPRDLPRAKYWFERGAEGEDFVSMCGLRLVFHKGCEGVPKNLPLAKRWYELAVEGGDVDAMNNLGLLLEKGGDGVAKDVVRAKELYELSLKGGGLLAMSNLAFLLTKGADGISRDITRAKQLLERAVASGDVVAMGVFAHFLRYGTNGFPKDTARAQELQERAVAADEKDELKKVAERLQELNGGVQQDKTPVTQPGEVVAASNSMQTPVSAKEHHSVLETAYISAVRDSSIIDEPFLLKHIVAGNTRSAADLLWGHNLILLSIRAGILTRDNIRRIGDSTWYLQDNLYYPATKLTQEHGAFVDAIFQHAENIGIITSGYALKIGRGIRADMAKDLGGIEQAIQALSDRVGALEGNMEELHSAFVKLCLREQKLQKAVGALTNSLNELKQALQTQNRRMQYAQVARCMLSFVPLIGKAVGETTYTVANILMNLKMEDLVPAGVDLTKAIVTEMACVDLSNFQVARYAFSEQVVSKLDGRARSAVIMSICASEFKSPGALERLLQQQIETIGREDASVALVDIGSSSWMSSSGSNAISSERPPIGQSDGLEGKARRYFHFLVHGTRKGWLTLPKATEGVNHLLKECDGMSEVPRHDLENVYFQLADEEDDEVTEELFVGVFQEVSRRQERNKRRDKVIEEARKRFQERVYDEAWLSIEYAARVMCKLYKEMQQGGFVESGTTVELERVFAVLRKADTNGNDRIEEAEFVAAMREVLDEL